MHRIRQLVLAGFAPPDCFEPATAEIASELTVALALNEYLSVADWRAYLRIRRDFANKNPGERGQWGGELAKYIHELRAFG